MSLSKFNNHYFELTLLSMGLLSPLLLILNVFFSFFEGRFFLVLIIIVLAFIKLVIMLLYSDKYVVGFYPALLLSFFSLLVLLKFLPFLSADYFAINALLMEFKPVLILFSSFIILCGVSADRSSIYRCIYIISISLSVLFILDSLVSSYIAGNLKRATHTGEINYEAMILLVSICFLLNRDKAFDWRLLLVVLGIMATMSRTAVITLTLIFFISNRFSFSLKLLVASLSVSVFFASAYSRGLSPLDIESIDRFWMWTLALEIFETDLFRSVFIGYSPYTSLPAVAIPDQLAWMQSHFMGGKGDVGIYPFMLHSFWLRVTATWGVMATILIVAYLISLMLRRGGLVTSMSIVILLQGMTMGVFYISHAGMFLALLFIYELRKTYGFRANRNNTNF